MLAPSLAFFSNSIGFQLASFNRYESFVAVGFARTQNSNWPRSFAVTEYSASAGFLSAKLLIQSPPES